MATVKDLVTLFESNVASRHPCELVYDGENVYLNAIVPRLDENYPAIVAQTLIGSTLNGKG